MPAATTSGADPTAAPIDSHPPSRSPRPHHDPSFVHVLYDNSSHSFTPQITSSAMFNYLAHSQPSSNSWRNYRHHFTSNPYPAQPPPPPVAHKVWILDCRSCGTFLTNRGMKAVLLLRPNVSLFSSDALPVNCSAYTSNPDVLRPATSCLPASMSQLPLRTCECLTQSLCCHCCGATVGYMIVIPCSRCTSSITATNRATNGHRFVFHSSEIVGTERHYIPGEPGVIPYEPTTSSMFPSNTADPALPPLFYPPPLAPALAYSGQLEYTIPSQLFTQSPLQPHSQLPSPAPFADYLPTPPLEVADLSPVPSTSPSPTSSSFPFPLSSNHNPSESQSPPRASRVVTHPHHQSYRQHLRSGSPPFPVPSQSHYNFQHNPTSSPSSPSSNSSPPPLVHPFGMPAEQKESPSTRMLKAGDVLYWHHLTRNGEIPGVAEDERSRKRSLTVTGGVREAGRMVFDR